MAAETQPRLMCGQPTTRGWGGTKSGQGPPQAPLPQGSPGGWGFHSLPWVGMNTLGVGGTARRTRFRAQTPLCLFQAS